MAYLIINWLCIKILVEKLDTRLVIKVIKTKKIVFEVNIFDGIDKYM